MLNLRRTFPTKAIRVISLAPHLGPNGEIDQDGPTDEQPDVEEDGGLEHTAEESRRAAPDADLFEMVSLLADDSDDD